jgi:hypothetical protein
MVFLPDYTAFAVDIFAWRSVFGEPVGKSTPVTGDGGKSARSGAVCRLAFAAPQLHALTHRPFAGDGHATDGATERAT